MTITFTLHSKTMYYTFERGNTENFENDSHLFIMYLLLTLKYYA